MNRHISVEQVNELFHQYARKVNLPRKATVHSFRATFIAEALRNNCPIEDGQQSVVHSSISTTISYDHRKKEHRKSASFRGVF
ncbi:MAG: tyrosine-type recombinase/integrase [Magnetococcales bacterium]|nr:tyrosine-type recombinase/integrase [Magnetococcales bacterium]